MKSRRYLLCLVALLVVRAVRGQPYETPPELKASDFLDAALLQGPDYIVEPVSRAFRLNPQYNLTRQVRLVASLDGTLPRPAPVAITAAAR